MPTICFDANTHELASGESVLECLLRNGHAIPNSCRAGVCQACLLKTSSGTVPVASTQSLKSTLSAQGYFLSCVCRPETDLTVEVAGHGVRWPTRIASISLLSHDAVLLQLESPPGFEHRAGQYVTLVRADGLARSYSVASLPGINTIDLHIRRVPQGAFSNWLHDEAKTGDVLSLQGPAGDCFYMGGSPDQSLLLAGTGTGLAPLYGIVQDAIWQRHTGPIWIFHGALRPEGLYLRTELQLLAAKHSNVHYVPSVLESESLTDDSIQVGRIDEVIFRQHAKLGGWRGFICGDPGIVRSLKTKFFLAGMSNREIFADAFLQSSQPQ